MALQTKKYIELEDLSSYFDEKYHQNYLYDKLGTDLHFYQWHKNKGYPELDTAGNRAGASRIWLKEYMLDITGEKAKPERLDFWNYTFNYRQLGCTGLRQPITDTHQRRHLWDGLRAYC